MDMVNNVILGRKRVRKICIRSCALLNLYQKFNHLFSRLLWIFIILGFVSSLPLIYQRIQAEQSSTSVEFVFDYSDLVTMSQQENDSVSFIQASLQQVKEAGIGTIVVSENSLEELQKQKLLRYYTSDQAAALTGNLGLLDSESLYLMFADKKSYDRLRPWIEQELEARGITSKEYSWPDGKHGMVIHAAEKQVKLVSFFPDLELIDSLKEQGFRVSVRLSDNHPFDVERMEQLLSQLSSRDVRTIIFSGTAVTGFGDDEQKQSLKSMSELMSTYGIGFALIETDPSKQGQKGIEKLAYLTNYNVVRLHSIAEEESSKLSAVLSDRIVLAVEDRNIRMVFLNATSRLDTETSKYTNTLFNLLASVKGEAGAIARLEHQGYSIGVAEPFQYVDLSVDNGLKLALMIGGTALVVLLLSMFVPGHQLVLFMLGLSGVAGGYIISPKLMLQAMALGVSVAAPSLSIILAVQWLKKQAKDRINGTLGAYIQSLKVFLLSCLITSLSFFYVAGLLNGIPFIVRIELFRGISMLKLAPILLTAIYYIFFGLPGGVKQGGRFLKRIMMMNIKVIYVVAAALVCIGGIYYLSRAGNSGQTLPYEKELRAFLEDALIVRPRFQEFVIGHPFFLFASYYFFKYRKGLFLIILGTVGQLSMVNTFTHLHTPYLISGVRVLNGMWLGILLSMVLICMGEILRRTIYNNRTRTNDHSIQL